MYIYDLFLKDDIVDMPQWLLKLLRRTFFDKCSLHHHRGKTNELNRYCISCDAASCKNCISEGHHRGHDVLTIYRHVYRDWELAPIAHKSRYLVNSPYIIHYFTTIKIVIKCRHTNATRNGFCRWIHCRTMDQAHWWRTIERAEYVEENCTTAIINSASAALPARWWPSSFIYIYKYVFLHGIEVYPVHFEWLYIFFSSSQLISDFIACLFSHSHIRCITWKLLFLINW